MRATCAVQEPTKRAFNAGCIRRMKTNHIEEAVERRIEDRMNAYMPITVALRDARAEEGAESAITVNVSEGGIYFISATCFRPGDRITVALVEEEGVTGEPVEAEVIHTAPFRSAGAEEGKNTVRGTGVWLPGGARFFARAREKYGKRNGGFRS